MNKANAFNKPILQAILVADHIYTDKMSGKNIVAGIFHDLYFFDPQQLQQLTESGKAPLPFAPGQRSGSPYAYVSLTEVHGNQQFQLRYVNVANEKLHFDCNLDVQCKDPLATVELIVPLPALPANEPGAFALELLWKGEPLGSFRIAVKQMKLPEPGDTQS